MRTIGMLKPMARGLIIVLDLGFRLMVRGLRVVTLLTTWNDRTSETVVGGTRRVFVGGGLGRNRRRRVTTNNA